MDNSGLATQAAPDNSGPNPMDLDAMETDRELWDSVPNPDVALYQNLAVDKRLVI